MRGSSTRMKLMVDRAEIVQSSLRDEIVWRDCSAEADSATKAKNQSVA